MIQNCKLANLHSYLPNLISNKIIGIKILDFYSSLEILEINNSIPYDAIEWYPEYALGRIGYSLKEVQDKNSPIQIENYFKKSLEIEKLFSSLFSKTINPINKIEDSFKRNGYKFGIAFDEDFKQKYNYGVLELQKCGRNLHVDNFPENKVNLSFATNLQKGMGGQTEIYNKMSCGHDGYLDLDLNYADFEKVITSSTNKYVIDPLPGEAYIFHNQFYHKVLPTIGDKYRISFLSVIKQVSDDAFVVYV